MALKDLYGGISPWPPVSPPQTIVIGFKLFSSGAVLNDTIYGILAGNRMGPVIICGIRL